MLDSTQVQWTSLQQAILNAGPDALRSWGYEFAPIDNNPRHGVLSLSAKVEQRSAGYCGTSDIRETMVEVVERCGLWWVLPTRPFRFV